MKDTSSFLYIYPYCILVIVEYVLSKTAEDQKDLGDTVTARVCDQSAVEDPFGP